MFLFVTVHDDGFVTRNINRPYADVFVHYVLGDVAAATTVAAIVCALYVLGQYKQSIL